MICLQGIRLAVVAGLFAAAAHGAEPVDFNREIRPVLSNLCYKCHGPDENERQGGTEGLRLDTADGAYADQGGTRAIVPGKPAESELLRRVQATGDEMMPPPGHGRRLTSSEIELLTRWIQQGAPYAKHWSYEKPVRVEPPTVHNTAWPKNVIDRFLLARMEQAGLQPAEPADRAAIIRRLSLDLTGLPPTLAEVDEFLQDQRPDAYEQLVDRFLKKESFGEHWARMWLDLARYADSAGYADDPTRTIWAFRDYVIRSFNANKPFDQFTIEQLAGDLLENPTEEQLMATAFHRNTLTNSEGGTNDEEFRNVAIVDRVNTTWTVWMGTSMTCAQCHTHKYDPITQTEFFQFLAIFNNTADADRRDETPLLEFFTADQKQRRTELEGKIETLEKTLQTPTPELLAELEQWDKSFPRELPWRTPAPSQAKSLAGSQLTVESDQTITAAGGPSTDTYEVELPLTKEPLAALRLEALTHDSLPQQGPGHAGGNFVISKIAATLVPSAASPVTGRYLRIEIPGKQKILSLAEVQIFHGQDNLAVKGTATQSSTDFDGPAKYAIDGNTEGKYEAKSVTHTAISADPWWEVDLQAAQPVERIVIWNRTDPGVEGRLANFRVSLLDEKRQPVWEEQVATAPQPSAELATSGARAVPFAIALADATQEGFDPQHVLANPDPKTKGWAVGGQLGKPHTLTLLPKSPLEVPEGARLVVRIEQQSQHEKHTLGRFRLSVTSDPRAAEVAKTPADVVTILSSPAGQRSDDQRQRLREYFLANVAPALQPTRDQLASARKQLADMKPSTVPILRELPADQQRTTNLQFRGNFLDLGPEVQPGIPAAFHPLPSGAAPNRLTIARWLVDPENPLTARVLVNRFWEQVFGTGLVLTSEEFGSQGELPSHPELLDWLAVEFVESGWNMKHLIRLLVTSAAYRQSSKVTPQLYEKDPDNRLLARGPRFRLSAEMVRDQALSVSGLLSRKMYGPSVKPPQPALGLNAAFGSAIDWKTSDGEDRYRRGIYTEWRRSNPYPSMITFDAPNREVCIIRRARTNTPLQALVTLNDPVYIESAQALARRIATSGTTAEEKMRFAYRVCLARPPYEQELQRMLQLFEETRADYEGTPEAAREMATNPIGPAPPDANIAELAAWTVVANVILNLDEMLMKR